MRPEIVDKIDKISRLFKNPQGNEAEIAQEQAIYVICDASVQFR